MRTRIGRGRSPGRCASMDAHHAVAARDVVNSGSLEMTTLSSAESPLRPRGVAGADAGRAKGVLRVVAGRGWEAVDAGRCAAPSSAMGSMSSSLSALRGGDVDLVRSSNNLMRRSSSACHSTMRLLTFSISFATTSFMWLAVEDNASRPAACGWSKAWSWRICSALKPAIARSRPASVHDREVCSNWSGMAVGGASSSGRPRWQGVSRVGWRGQPEMLRRPPHKSHPILEPK